MSSIKMVLVVTVLLLLLMACHAKTHVKEKTKPENLILVTIDGLRWQEVFAGADANLIGHKEYVKDADTLKQTFWHDDAEERRKLLMPFFWSQIIDQGVLVGNRNKGSKMSVSNVWFFSYPGYSEIVTGLADNARINSNKKFNNPNVSFIEWLNQKAEFENKLAVFGSWDVFPYIYNRERSGLYINAGFESAQSSSERSYPVSTDMALLNALQKEIPSPWATVRLDAFTHRYALDYLQRVQPRVMIIHYGETDDFAHDGRYDHYLHAARRTDQFIKELWQTLQSHPRYQNNTVMLITTDHGRGSEAKDWQHHASKRSLQGYMESLKRFEEGILGSENIWFAAMGPSIPSKGEVIPAEEIKLSQVAATAVELLGYKTKDFSHKASHRIDFLFE